MGRRGPVGPLVLGGNVVLCAFFVSGAYYLLRSGGDGGRVAGVLVLALGVVIGLAVVGNVLQMRFPRGLKPPRATTLGDERGIRLPGWPLGTVVLIAILVLATPAGLLLGLGALLAGQYAFGPLALLGGLYLAWFDILLISRRYPLAAGFTLTPTLVMQYAGGSSSRIAWDDVLTVVDASPDVIVTARGTGGADRRRTTAWGRRIVDRADELVVDTTILGVPSDRLAALLEHYRDDREARQELGGRQGLVAFQHAAYPEVQATN